MISQACQALGVEGSLSLYLGKQIHTTHWFGIHLEFDEDSVSCKLGDDIYE